MLKIRLSKTGKKNAPSYRIIVIPKEKSRDGEALEILGHFNPSATPPSLSIDKDRLKYWVDRGAQMTEAVKNIVAGKYEFKPYVPKRGEAESEEAKNITPEKDKKEEKKPATIKDTAEKGEEKQNEKDANH